MSQWNELPVTDEKDFPLISLEKSIFVMVSINDESLIIVNIGT
ncbi:hypothetical protein ACIQ34_00410 [Ureibacillus sp. NPDC094379]